MFNITVHDEADKEIQEMPLTIRAKLLAVMKKLKENGNQLGMPHSKPLKDGLFELRTQGTTIARSLYAFKQGKEIFILSAFIKKTQKTPASEIEKARKRLQEMIE